MEQKLLITEQKFEDRKTSDNSYKSLQRDVSGDNTWIYEYVINWRLSARSGKKKSNDKEWKAQNNEAKIGFMLIALFDCSENATVLWWCSG